MDNWENCTQEGLAYLILIHIYNPEIVEFEMIENSRLVKKKKKKKQKSKIKKKKKESNLKNMEFAINLLEKYYGVKKLFKKTEDLINLPLLYKINHFLTNMFERLDGVLSSEKLNESPRSSFPNQSKIFEELISKKSVFKDWKKFDLSSISENTEDGDNSSTCDKDEKSSSELISFSENYKESYPQIFKYKIKNDSKDIK